MTIGGGGLGLLMLATGAGAFVQAATGFGFAIVAAPVFLAVLESKAAVGLLVALHVVQSLLLVPRVASAVPLRRLGLLLAGAVAGAPLGLLVLGALDLRQLKLAAGVVILTAAGAIMWRRRRIAAALARSGAARHGSATDGIATGEVVAGEVVTGGSRTTAGATTETVLAGAVAGALTALLVMPGPPTMLYLMRQPLAAAPSRALSLTFFAACYVAVLAMSAAAGALRGIDWLAACVLVAPVLLGTIAGSIAARHLVGRHYVLALDVLLVLAGVGAIASAI